MIGKQHPQEQLKKVGEIYFHELARDCVRVWIGRGFRGIVGKLLSLNLGLQFASKKRIQSNPRRSSRQAANLTLHFHESSPQSQEGRQCTSGWQLECLHLLLVLQSYVTTIGVFASNLNI